MQQGYNDMNSLLTKAHRNLQYVLIQIIQIQYERTGSLR